MTMTSDRTERLEQLLRARLGQKRPPSGGTRTAEWFAAHVNPPLSRLLTAVGLDITYQQGQGTVLVDADGRRYLDFAGAYGALPLGHNPESVWAAMKQVQTDSEPSLVQLSVNLAQAELARVLQELAPDQISSVTFANSGSEAVEAALKLARSATGRLGILSTDRSFHGKTLGALSATGNSTYQLGFAAPVSGHATVPFGDAEAICHLLAERTFAAVIVEPIQGEGGVNVPSEEYLEQIRAACDETGTLMIADEVQTGLGRTGRMFASTSGGVVPDIITVAKALGGGLVPMGAVLAKPELVTEHFSLRHTSTFAGGSLACRVGLSVLERLQDPELQRNIQDRHEQLTAGLRALAAEYPHVVTDVRGRGLLIGLELSHDIRMVGRQSLLGSIANGGNLAMLVASHLLRVHGIRIAPTLFGNRVLRVEPPLTVTERECGQFLRAMEDTIRLVAQGDSSSLLAHLVGRAPEPLVPDPDTGHVWRAAERDEYQFAFIAHPLEADSLHDFDGTLRDWSDAERLRLLERFAKAGSTLNPAPFLVGSGAVISSGGARVYGELIGIPYTAEQLMSVPSADAVEVVRQAVDLAVERGAKVVGLGAYSSIVTNNALALGDMSVPVTTGNTFTAAASVGAVRSAVAARGEDLVAKTVAIIGAGGAIGRVMSLVLAPDVQRILLVGRPGGEQSPRLQRTRQAVEDRLAVHGSTTEVDVMTDAAAAARQADIVVTATSSPGTLLGEEDIRAGMIVCDVAQPPNIAPDAASRAPDVTFFDGGIVALPNGQDFGLRTGIHYGMTYACMAETMVIALEAAEERSTVDLLSRGEELELDNVIRLADIASSHGFTLAPTKTWRHEEKATV